MEFLEVKMNIQKANENFIEKANRIDQKNLHSFEDDVVRILSGPEYCAQCRV